MRWGRAAGAAAICACTLSTACSDDDATSVESIDVGGDPRSVAVVDGSVWVVDARPAEGAAGAELVRLDPETEEVDMRIPISADLDRLAITDDALWVYGSRTMQRVDLETNVVSATVDRDTWWLAFADGRLFAIADGRLFELEPETGEEIGPVELDVLEVLDAPILGTDGALWISVFDGGPEQVARFDLEEMAITSVVTPVERPTSLVTTGGLVWTLGRNRSLDGLDAKTGEIVQRDASLPSGQILDEGETSLTVGEDGTMWAVAQPEQVLYQLDPMTGEVVGSVSLEVRPGSIAADADSVWTNNASEGQVTRVERAAFDGDS